MKVLTLTQPWATLVVLGFKNFETRSWPTNHRGPLAIHAAKGFDRLALEMYETEDFQFVLKGRGYHRFDDLPRGAIVGTCRVTEIWKTEDLVHPAGPPYGQIGRMEYNFGDWRPGRFAWKLEEPQLFQNPIPAKGALGLWEWNRERPGRAAKALAEP